MFKKLLPLFLFMAIALCIYYSPKKQEVATVWEENTSQTYYLDFSNTTLTTKNFEEYFDSSYQVIQVLPVLNPLYESKLGKVAYTFQPISISYNLNQFEKYLESVLQKNGYLQDLEKIPYQGVRIREVVAYLNSTQVHQLVKKNPKVKY